MNHKVNPFHELYFTESIDSEDFVRLFSDVLVEPALPLFKPGNVILKGLPGSGKTMMLNLLKPSIRIAYAEAGVKFPVPSKFDKFIGAGINLIRSSVSDFGQRPIEQGKADDLNELAVFFGDFLNYWIVRDILDSIEVLARSVGKEIGINLNEETLSSFVTAIINDECWFGFIKTVKDFDGLKEKFRHRTNTYRSYLNYNCDTIPEEIKTSKTSIGVPIITLVQKLRESGIIKKDVQVYVRIDQYEELTWLDSSIPNLGSIFQSVIHKLLAMRDSTVSYRIGTRPFDWKQGNQRIFGTSAQLESSRNYKEISIEDVLRRSESQRGYIFPQFAEDIFSRRLKLATPSLIKGNETLKDIFGEGFTASEKSEMIVKTGRQKIILPHEEWPEEWTKFLKELAFSNPFSAKLGEAWALQRDKSQVVNNIPKSPPFPWDEKKYWIKERAEQALLQIASRARQGIIWSGKDDILKLSGGNILSFLSICQHIWEVWMRDQKKETVSSAFNMDYTIQTLGILEASRLFFENINSTPEGREMKLFIVFLGTLFYKRLTDDYSMSYPGENGFSVIVEELESNNSVLSFLERAADRGFLVERPHTPKTKGKLRVKWYLNPLLSPYFKIPAIRTKEPMYISIIELDEWLVKSGAFESTTIKEDTTLPNTPEKEATKKRKPKSKGSNNGGSNQYTMF